MANMFNMMKEAATMQRQMKKIQKELARQTVEGSSGDVTVVACGDMSVKSVSIGPAALNSGNPEQLERMIVAAANSALASAKKRAGSEMSKMTGGLGGLADMLKC